jgi:hypothetical protein
MGLNKTKEARPFPKTLATFEELVKSYSNCQHPAEYLPSRERSFSDYINLVEKKGVARFIQDVIQVFDDPVAEATNSQALEAFRATYLVITQTRVEAIDDLTNWVAQIFTPSQAVAPALRRPGKPCKLPFVYERVTVFGFVPRINEIDKLCQELSFATGGTFWQASVEIDLVLKSIL